MSRCGAGLSGGRLRPGPGNGAVCTRAGGRRFPASESWLRRQRDSTFARLDYGPRSRAADRPRFVPAPRPQPPEARMSLTIRRKSILAVAALALAAPVAAQNPIAPMKGIGQKLGKGLGAAATELDSPNGAPAKKATAAKSAAPAAAAPAKATGYTIDQF